MLFRSVVLFSLGGNLETAFALPAIYSDACPPPSDSESADVTAYEDGGWFEYDPATGRWIIRGVKSVLIESSQLVSCKTEECVFGAGNTRARFFWHLYYRVLRMRIRGLRNDYRTDC